MSNEIEKEYRVVVRRCRKTGNAIEESWYQPSGERSRGGAPARLEWDPNTRNLIMEEFWSGGMLHSPLSGKHPAQSSFDPVSGEHTCRVWMRYGEKHRTGDLPAVEFVRNGKPIRHEYWVDGQLYRKGGAPIINYDPQTGEVISTADQLEELLQSTPHGYFDVDGPS